MPRSRPRPSRRWRRSSASGATVQQPAASAALTRVLAAALDLALGMKDDYVATEHLLIALAGTDSSAQKLLADAGRAPRRADRRTREPTGHLPGRRVDVRGTENLFCTTQSAEDGKLDPVIGRDAEIRRVVQVLLAYQEQPGADGAGVGKTAVVEGLAHRR